MGSESSTTALLVGATQDDETVIVQDLTDPDDLAGGVEAANVDDVVRLVEQYLLSAFPAL